MSVYELELATATPVIASTPVRALMLMTLLLTLSAPSRFSAEKKVFFLGNFIYFSFYAREKHFTGKSFFLANWLNFFIES